MARTPAQRGKVGNWLVESRLARGWDTQEKARAEIDRLTGWRVPQSVYAEWESGRRIPSDANLEKLRAFYGHGETGPSTTGEAGLGALVVALSGFVDELREDRRIRQEQIGALLQSIQEDRMARQEWETGFLGAMLELATIATRQDDQRDELPASAPAHARH